MTRDVFITDARRTPVVPRGGKFAELSVSDLSVPLFRSMYEENPTQAQINLVVAGNALYGGGNPARLIALAAGIDQSVPAMTIDTQCCAGLDAILLASDAVRTGRAAEALAGGVESFSRAPIRMRRGLGSNDAPVPYDRPPFTPWADRDPDMIAAAADLALARDISRAEQETFAIRSHEKARNAAAAGACAAEVIPIAGVTHDAYTRNLSPRLCERLPVLAGGGSYAITTATTAVEADAAAFVTLSATPNATGPLVRIRDALYCGADPAMPGLAPIDGVQKLLQRNGLQAGDIDCVEIMEAFAAQAMAFIDAFGFSSSIVNVSGGALARGHPIGASGAILAVRLFHELRGMKTGSVGLAAIAGAGGLASCLLLERV
jgi:acetyl-CoA C-acetyltransferase